MTTTELDQDAISVAKDLKSKYATLFAILVEIEKRKAYREFEVVSLYDYCVSRLELSPDIANDFNRVVKKSIEVPELQEAIRSQEVTISKARKLCSVITTADATEWIDVAKRHSCRVVEKAVATANPKSSVYESMRYIAADVLEFKMPVGEEFERLLKKTKDIMSQKHKRAVSSEEALLTLMKSYCEKNDPVERAARAQTRAQTRAMAQRESRTDNGKVDQTVKADEESAAAKIGDKTRYRPAAIEHAVNLRDQNQCTYIGSNGKRCAQRRWLQKHHITHFAKGGTHAPENLITLCFAHHQMAHEAQGVANFSNTCDKSVVT